MGAALETESAILWIIDKEGAERIEGNLLYIFTACQIKVFNLIRREGGKSPANVDLVECRRTAAAGGASSTPRGLEEPLGPSHEFIALHSSITTDFTVHLLMEGRLAVLSSFSIVILSSLRTPISRRAMSLMVVWTSCTSWQASFPKYIWKILFWCMYG